MSLFCMLKFCKSKQVAYQIPNSLVPPMTYAYDNELSSKGRICRDLTNDEIRYSRLLNYIERIYLHSEIICRTNMQFTYLKPVNIIIKIIKEIERVPIETVYLRHVLVST